MKLETLSNVYLIISVLVPGFIYNGVLLNFVPLRQDKEKELIILRLLTATAYSAAHNPLSWSRSPTAPRSPGISAGIRSLRPTQTGETFSSNGLAHARQNS